MLGKDWRDEQAYPDASTSDVEWAWQFLRRNETYQEDWEYELECYREDPLKYETVARAVEFEITPGEATGSEGRRYYLENYGIYSLRPPESDEPGNISFEPRYGFIWSSLRQGTEYKSILLAYGQAVVEFDLTQTLHKQLEKAEEVLKIKQAAFQKNETRKRIEPKRFQNYLRLLDASSAEVDVNEMAAVIFEDIPNDDPNFTGAQRVRDGLERATILRDGGYRSLVIGWYSPDRKK